MQLTCLRHADIIRDGGSYQASFQDNGGKIRGLWLQCSRLTDHEGLHHGHLYAFEGEHRPEGLAPIGKGSHEEGTLYACLDAFLEAPCLCHPTEGDRSIERLRALRYHAEKREG